MAKIFVQEQFLAELYGAEPMARHDCRMGKKVVPRFKGAAPGHFVREWRKHRGFTQEQLAERIGVSVGLISQLETGRVAYTQSTLEGIADALSTSPASLIMRNPVDDSAIWALEEQLAKATPDQRRQAFAIVETLLKTGSDG